MELTLYRGAQEIIAEIGVDEETGEISAEYPLEVLVQRNPIGCAAYVLQTEAQAEMIKRHIDEMQRKYKAALSRSDRVKKSLAEAMAMTGTISLESPDATFKVKLQRERDASVDVFDEKQLPTDYLREIPAKYEPDKKLIRKAIDDGFDVPGARIVKKDRLVIR